MATAAQLTELATECGYDPGEDVSLDALIAYKDALEDRARREGEVLDEINAMLSRSAWEGGVGMLEDIEVRLRRVREPMSPAERRAALGGEYLSH